jgi:hypothetical protein
VAGSSLSLAAYSQLPGSYLLFLEDFDFFLDFTDFFFAFAIVVAP